MKLQIRNIDIGVFALYRDGKFVRSYPSKLAAKKALERAKETRGARVAPTPHKFVVRYTLRNGKRKTFELRSSSTREAAALFFVMTGLKLNDIKAASIMYSGRRVPRDLTEVL